MMQGKKEISAAMLKTIALVSMLIDHTAAVILGSMIRAGGGEEIQNLYLVLRNVIGRWAFPIYCFLLVEGVMRTRNKGKYVCRMFVFALLSEIPFDLAFYGKIWNPQNQNVFFTLLIGLLVMIGSQQLEKCGKSPMTVRVGELVMIVAACGLAELISCDYGMKGILAITLLYLFRKNKMEQILVGCIAFIWEIGALLAFIPIAFYKGKKGKGLKYFFYFFYPVHLLVLYLIERMLPI